jgi:hypothetical protein
MTYLECSKWPVHVPVRVCVYIYKLYIDEVLQRSAGPSGRVV